MQFSPSLGGGGGEPPYFPSFIVGNRGSEKLACPKAHDLEGQHWDMSPGLPDSKSVCLTTTPHGLPGHHGLQALLQDSAAPQRGSPPGSSVRGILQARILEWGAVPFSKGSFRSRTRTWVS